MDCLPLDDWLLLGANTPLLERRVLLLLSCRRPEVWPSPTVTTDFPSSSGFHALTRPSSSCSSSAGRVLPVLEVDKDINVVRRWAVTWSRMVDISAEWLPDRAVSIAASNVSSPEDRSSSPISWSLVMASRALSARISAVERSRDYSCDTHRRSDRSRAVRRPVLNSSAMADGSFSASIMASCL